MEPPQAHDDDTNFIATTSQQTHSREMLSFGTTSRFLSPPAGKMFSNHWTETELLPLLTRYYGPHLPADHDWLDDLRRAEWNEPHHTPSYPLQDPLFVERIRLTLANPGKALQERPTLVENVVRDRMLTIRLLIRKYTEVLEDEGVEMPLASLGTEVREELRGDYETAGAMDVLVTGLFVKEVGAVLKVEEEG
ncbi:hypothetical protein EJ04DRAFT_527917 [Polyplosphaeria fusca]|uniref:Uncharacterized protein n=1 Tax=Polyplosphaeria fusca TaxID=682080 RepID=A0A9P4QR00_9PLEO|nr:hypothetical protein EJ04DRAFT_527917 [Polyplosphaeria fusca]